LRVCKGDKRTVFIKEKVKRTPEGTCRGGEPVYRYLCGFRKGELLPLASRKENPCPQEGGKEDALYSLRGFSVGRKGDYSQG